MNLNEHEIRDIGKIETKRNNKELYIQSCHIKYDAPNSSGLRTERL